MLRRKSQEEIDLKVVADQVADVITRGLITLEEVEGGSVEARLERIVVIELNKDDIIT